MVVLFVVVLGGLWLLICCVLLPRFCLCLFRDLFCLLFVLVVKFACCVASIDAFVVVDCLLSLLVLVGLKLLVWFGMLFCGADCLFAFCLGFSFTCLLLLFVYLGRCGGFIWVLIGELVLVIDCLVLDGCLV